MKKIIHITPSYKPAYVYGGPVISVGKLCETLAAQSLNIKVLTTRANGEMELTCPDRDMIEGVDVRYFNRITKDHSHFSPSLLWTLHNETKTKEPGTIIHIHSWWNLVAVLSCLLARMKGLPVVVSPRGMLTEYTLKNRNSFTKQLVHKLLGKHLLKNLVIHATTELEKEHILSLVRPKKIEVIPNLIYFPQHNNCSKNIEKTTLMDRGPLRLLFLSRIQEKKGLDLLFRALAICKFPWSLTIAGTGEQSYRKKLVLLASGLKIARFIKWVGLVKNEDKDEVFANHNLLVLFSHNENFANVVLESLSCGLAVAVSDKVGLASFVKTNELGWVVKLKAREISASLTDAYENPQRVASIRRTAPPVVKAEFNEKVITGRYLELYNRLT